MILVMITIDILAHTHNFLLIQLCIWISQTFKMKRFAK